MGKVLSEEREEAFTYEGRVWKGENGRLRANVVSVGPNEESC